MAFNYFNKLQNVQIHKKSFRLEFFRNCKPRPKATLLICIWLIYHSSSLQHSVSAGELFLQFNISPFCFFSSCRSVCVCVRGNGVCRCEDGKQMQRERERPARLFLRPNASARLNTQKLWNHPCATAIALSASLAS